MQPTSTAGNFTELLIRPTAQFGKIQKDIFFSNSGHFISVISVSRQPLRWPKSITRAICSCSPKYEYLCGSECDGALSPIISHARTIAHTSHANRNLLRNIPRWMPSCAWMGKQGTTLLHFKSNLIRSYDMFVNAICLFSLVRLLGRNNTTAYVVG